MIKLICKKIKHLADNKSKHKANKRISAMMNAKTDKKSLIEDMKK